MGHRAGTVPVYMALATYVPALSVVGTTLHSFWERCRSQVVFHVAAAPGWTVCDPVALQAAQSAVDQISSLPDTTRSTKRESNTTTQGVCPVLVMVTARSAFAEAATDLGPVTASDSRLGTHSVVAAAELGAADALLTEGVAEADVGCSVAEAEGVVLDSATGTVAVDAGVAVLDLPRIADAMAAMIASTTTIATRIRARRTQYTLSGS